MDTHFLLIQLNLCRRPWAIHFRASLMKDFPCSHTHTHRHTPVDWRLKTKTLAVQSQVLHHSFGRCRAPASAVLECMCGHVGGNFLWLCSYRVHTMDAGMNSAWITIKISVSLLRYPGIFCQRRKFLFSDPIDTLRPQSGLAGLQPPLCMKRELTGQIASWLMTHGSNCTRISPLRVKWAV